MAAKGLSKGPLPIVCVLGMGCIERTDRGSKMTVSGSPEIAQQDVPWTLAARLTKIFKTSLKKPIFIKVLDNHLIHSEGIIIDYIRLGIGKSISTRPI